MWDGGKAFPTITGPGEATQRRGVLQLARHASGLRRRENSAPMGFWENGKAMEKPPKAHGLSWFIMVYLVIVVLVCFSPLSPTDEHIISYDVFLSQKF